MPTIKITSKRQVTFPADTCEELNLQPGDTVELERTLIGGEKVWLLRPKTKPSRDWIGALKTQAMVTNHSMDSIRASIAKGRANQS